ncbi:MAG: aminotransferase class I/II-fold pyridoxal phosphate-dependent enzyme [Deltaproteobacteria bacterium]|nr:aminotransferase class I/II-fold pyridoxal phosphate-dependent enzyme [Deltaproteobacteria bacterium]
MKQRNLRTDRSPAVNLNLNVRGMRPSATVAINEHSNALIAQGREVFKLGLGQSPFPVPDAVTKELQVNAFQKDYLPVKGLLVLRQAVADYHRRTQGTPFSADDVLIGPGSKELMFLLQLVYYGDLVIPAPAWVSYAPQARIIGRQVRFMSTRREDQWKLMPAQLEALCAPDPERPRIVILNYPSNPTGGTYSSAELKELAAVARKYRVILLSDEIYGELHHKGQHVSLARFYPEGTIVSAGLSKWCGAGGWRLGTFAFPHTLGWLRDAMAAVASETFTSTSAPIQYAAVRAFQGGLDIERYLVHSRRILKHLGRWCAKTLGEAGVQVAKPEGGFYLFPDFEPLRARLEARGIHSGAQLCLQMLDEVGVAMLPGEDFGRPAEELTARLAYVDFDGAKALFASTQVPLEEPLPDTFLDAQCYNCTEAIRRVASWLGE